MNRKSISLRQKHVKDVMKIMGVDEGMVRLLPKITSRCNTMNPWRRSLPGIFRGFRLHSGQELLDIPCGEGGVSVPLARKYRIRVTGYDILPEYVQRANGLSCNHGVADLCRFAIGDIRDIVKLKKKVDILLWIAPPHIWGKSKPTIKALRSCVKIGGVIVIGDAYLYFKANGYDDYETLEATTEGYTSLGDNLRRFYDYRGTLWKHDYEMERKLIQSAIHKTKDETDKRTLMRYLKKQNENEKSDRKHLGTAIWIIERR